MHKTSPFSWRGLYQRADVTVELIPENLKPSMETSNLKLSVASQRLSVEFPNKCYMSPDGREIIVFGPVKIGRSIIAFGQPKECPLGAMLMIAVRGDDRTEDTIGEASWLAEAELGEHLENHDYGYAAAMAAVLAEFYKNISNEYLAKKEEK